MQQENPIGLAELIDQVKSELLARTAGANGIEPLLSVDKVELELHVTVHREGNAGIRIHVIEVGGKLSSEDVQIVKVSLSPLLSTEQRLDAYKKRYPDRWQELQDVSIDATFKGNAQRPLGDSY